MTTICVVLAIASFNKWHLHQLDANNAFLYGDLKEDIYMTIPQGLHGYSSSQCCKLNKSLYGLKQASHQWFAKLSTLLLSFEYMQAHADHNLFTKATGSSFTTLLVYVDDIVLASNSLDEIDHLKSSLHSHFHIRDLGKLKYFLGLEVAHSSTGLPLCQRKYCMDLISDASLFNSKSSFTPMDPSLRLHHDSSAPLEDPLPYRCLVGRLIYLTNKRPDIAFVTQQLSQFRAAPTHCHFQAALRFVRYPKSCPGKGLFFSISSSLHLLCFSDDDWVTCVDTCRSTTS